MNEIKGSPEPNIWKKIHKKLFPDAENQTQSLSIKLFNDCKIMIEYAINNGIKFPDWVGSSLSTIDIKVMKVKKGLSQNGVRDSKEKDITIAEAIDSDASKLTTIHTALSEIVAPATPLTIDYTTPRARFIFGENITIPLIRNMWIWSILFLIGWVLSFYFSTDIISTSTDIIPSNMDYSLWSSLQIFFSAGIGAYFYSLYTGNKYFVSRTFDPKYHTFYNNRIIIGIIAGFILANVLDLGSLTNTGNGVTKFTPSIIALLGGYSADAVNRILTRIVTMLTALVQGDAKDMVDAKAEEMKVKNEANIQKLKISTAGDLLKLASEEKGKLDQETYDKIVQMIDSLTTATPQQTVSKTK